MKRHLDWIDWATLAIAAVAIFYLLAHQITWS